MVAQKRFRFAIFAGLFLTIGSKILFQGSSNFPTRSSQLDTLNGSLISLGYQTLPQMDIGPSPTLMARKDSCLYRIASTSAEGATELYYIRSTGADERTIFFTAGRIYDGYQPRFTPFLMQQFYRFTRTVQLGLPFPAVYTATFDRDCNPEQDFRNATLLPWPFSW